METQWGEDAAIEVCGAWLHEKTGHVGTYAVIVWRGQEQWSSKIFGRLRVENDLLYFFP